MIWDQALKGIEQLNSKSMLKYKQHLINETSVVHATISEDRGWINGINLTLTRGQYALCATFGRKDETHPELWAQAVEEQRQLQAIWGRLSGGGWREKDIELLKRDHGQLLRWKAEALELEKQWNPQELAKVLGIELGVSIRPQILPAVLELKSALERQKKRAEELELHLAAIGDMAVRGWDPEVVGKVDQVVDTTKYKDLLRRLFSGEARACKAQAEAKALREAIGLLTTLHPTLEMNSEDPVGMAKAIHAHVTALEQQKNGAYSERNKLVAALCKLFPSSIEQHEGEDWENGWNVVYIDLPTGQVSWHIHDSELPLFAHVARRQGRKWDGHSTEVKYERLAALSSPDRDTQRYIDALENNIKWARELAEWVVRRSELFGSADPIAHKAQGLISDIDAMRKARNGQKGGI